MNGQSSEAVSMKWLGCTHDPVSLVDGFGVAAPSRLLLAWWYFPNMSSASSVFAI